MSGRFPVRRDPRSTGERTVNGVHHVPRGVLGIRMGKHHVLRLARHLRSLVTFVGLRWWQLNLNWYHILIGDLLKQVRDAIEPRALLVVVPRIPPRDYHYVKELAHLQFTLIKLQEWVRLYGLRICVLFEGRDAAGKGFVPEIY